MPNQRECQICLFVHPGLPYRECDLCEIKYHEICYFQRRPRSELNCDACSHVMEQNMGRKQKMEPICYICGKSNGVMKQIPGDRFVHVLCALTSKNICIETYKQFKIYEKKQLPIDKCHECSKMSSHLIACQFCEYKAHKECLPSEELYVGQDLQGNIKYAHNLLNFLFVLGYQSQTLSLILKCRKNWTKMPQSKFKRVVVCERQLKKYSWCFCGNPDLNNQQQNPSVICDGCNRFCHLSCTGMKDPKQIKSYFCPGCKCVDKFNKLSRFSDNIVQAVRLESVQYQISDLRQLDAFPFIYSNKMKKNLGNHLDDIIIYLAVKAIEEMASGNKEQNYNPEDFYELVRIVLDQKGKPTRNSKQLWSDYQQFIKKKDPEKILNFFKLTPPIFQTLDQQAIYNLIEQKITPVLKKIRLILESNYLPESLSELVDFITQARRIVRQHNKLRDIINRNLKGNLLLSFFQFKSSSATQQKVIQTLLSHFLLKFKMTNRDLQQLNSIKKRKCPNFQTQQAWSILIGSIKLSQSNRSDQIQDYLRQQSKVQNKISKQQQNSLMLSTILSNRAHNPRLFNILKKRVQNLVDNANLTQKQKRIKVCYQWSLITKKLHFGIEKKKISISSIIDLHRIMTKCSYPENQILKKMEQLHNQVKGHARLIRKIQSLNKVEKKNPMLQLQQFIFRPSLSDLTNAVKKLSKPKFQQIWGDLERFQILAELQKAEQLRQRVLRCLQYQDMFNIDQSKSEKLPTSAQNLQIILLKKQLIQSSVLVVNPYQFFQILSLVNEAEIRQKNLRWQIQKKSQLQNQIQLIRTVKQLIQKIYEQRPDIGLCQYNDVLYNQTLLQLVQQKLKVIDENRLLYFQKHVKRNKKWILDIRSLRNRNIKYISLQDLCGLQFKIKTSIFDHTKLIEQALLPLKYQCIQARRYLQQIVPYGKKMLCSINLKQNQNIYSPQNKFYKKVKQLVVKDFCLRLYERDCQSLKNIIFFQHRVNSKRYSNDLKSLILQFEKIYRSFSPYLHELTLVWEMILNIGEKIFEAFNEDKDDFEDNLLVSMERKSKKMLKLMQYMVQVCGVGEHKSKFQHIQKVFYRKHEQQENDSC